MTFSRSLILFLSLLFLSGQVEYRFAYCTVMKRVVDSRMILHCTGGRRESAGEQFLPDTHPMRSMKIISKTSTDVFDRFHHSKQTGPTHPDLPSACIALPHRAEALRPVLPVQDPSGDIPVSTCCLRF